MMRGPKRGAYLDHYNTFVVTNGNLVRILSQGDTPRTLERIAEGVLEAVRPAVPKLDGAVLTTTNDEW